METPEEKQEKLQSSLSSLVSPQESVLFFPHFMLCGGGYAFSECLLKNYLVYNLQLTLQVLCDTDLPCNAVIKGVLSDDCGVDGETYVNACKFTSCIIVFVMAIHAFHTLLLRHVGSYCLLCFCFSMQS